MESRTGFLKGSECPPFEVSTGGLKFHVDLMGGQKTGLYLDQLDNYHAVASLSAGRSVLDCFTNQGGFAIACAVAGASSVEGIDTSETAIASAAKNATLNQREIKFTCANVFDELKRRESAGEKFDLIILDPPSFTRNKRSVKDAMRGYKEIHLRALKMLAPDGVLATFSCSHHIGHDDFLEVIKSASVDAKQTLLRLAQYGPRRDHPIIATIPETEYLRGFALQVIPSW
jgi:23S rRNA (cytosine1962-C5)-methyltransferase